MVQLTREAANRDVPGSADAAPHTAAQEFMHTQLHGRPPKKIKLGSVTISGTRTQIDRFDLATRGLKTATVRTAGFAEQFTAGEFVFLRGSNIRRRLARVVLIGQREPWGFLCSGPVIKVQLVTQEGLVGLYRLPRPEIVSPIPEVDWWISELRAWCGSFWDSRGMSEIERGTHRLVLKNTTQVRLLTWRVVE